MSGPSATEKPRSAKIAVISSFTWLTGWIVPRGASKAGSDVSTRSVARRESSDALSSSFFRAHRAERLQELGDRALLAERCDAHVFERALGLGLAHGRDEIAFELGNVGHANPSALYVARPPSGPFRRSGRSTV